MTTDIAVTEARTAFQKFVDGQLSRDLAYGYLSRLQHYWEPGSDDTTPDAVAAIRVRNDVFAHVAERQMIAEVIGIVATDPDMGIGFKGHLPWRAPEDLVRFKKLTSGHAIIMGRKTYESIGRPLPNRVNIVLSKSGAEAPGAHVVRYPAQAMMLVREMRCPQAWVIGGAQIYALFRRRMTRIERTIVNGTYETDVRLSFPLGSFGARVSERRVDGLTFETWLRRSANPARHPNALTKSDPAPPPIPLR